MTCESRSEAVPIRVVVTGREGQVVRALIQGSYPGISIIPLGRPHLDLADTSSIQPALANARPDAIVNAAAFTAVDQAETESDSAFAVNAHGAGAVASVASSLSVPIVHLSTDYVFDGTKVAPYVETDPIGPLGVYGRSKLAGEHAVAEAASNHAILRTSWVYSPFGKNFVRTILRVAQQRATLDIVDDQTGSPTSAIDIADGIIAVVRNLIARPQDVTLRGAFHMVAEGEASWADVAEAVFDASKAVGGPTAAVRRIPSSSFPQIAKRPKNSRLDCTKIAAIHGVRLPNWRSSLIPCVERIVRESISET